MAGTPFFPKWRRPVGPSMAPPLSRTTVLSSKVEARARLSHRVVENFRNERGRLLFGDLEGVLNVGVPASLPVGFFDLQQVTAKFRRHLLERGAEIFNRFQVSLAFPAINKMFFKLILRVGG